MCAGQSDLQKWEGLSDRQVLSGARAVGPTVFTYFDIVYDKGKCWTILWARGNYCGGLELVIQ